MATGGANKRGAEINVHHARRAPIFAILKRDHVLAARASLSLADLLPFPLAIFGEGVTLRQLFDIGCGPEGLLFGPVLVSNYGMALYSFVRNPNAVTPTFANMRAQTGNVITFPGWRKGDETLGVGAPLPRHNRARKDLRPGQQGRSTEPPK
ncbi:LysR substrate-binding domain-containing protein [Paraburkholderia sediminicola]